MGDFKFPDVGEGIQEGEVVKWLVKEGDTVKENQNLVQVETDKSVVDLPSPEAGKITSIAAKAGQTVKVGGVLCTINGSGGSASKSSTPTVAPSKTAAQPTNKKQSQTAVKPTKSKTILSKQAKKFVPQKKGLAVVGQLEEAPETPAATSTPQKAPASQEPVTPKENLAPTPQPEEQIEYKSQAATMRGDVQSKKVLASPKIRELAKEHNINLAKTKGSGPAGRILKSDLKITSSVSQQSIPVTKSSNEHGPIEKIPLKGIRKVISDNMTLSHRIPQVTAMEDINITRLVALKDKQNKKLNEGHLTLLPFIVKATIAALKEHPYLNSELNEETNEIFLKKYYNIAIAVETPVGLMVPVVKNADQKPIIDISKEIQDLAQKARDRKISVEEMKGGTFTITNYGSIGGTYATPLINPGESAIIGIGRAFEKPDPNNPSKKIKVLPLSLTFDHRITDGAQAARFLESTKEYLEDPNHLFIEL